MLLNLRLDPIASRSIASTIEHAGENIVCLGRNKLGAFHAGGDSFKKRGLLLQSWERSIPNQQNARYDQRRGGHRCNRRQHIAVELSCQPHGNTLRAVERRRARCSAQYCRQHGARCISRKNQLLDYGLSRGVQKNPSNQQLDQHNRSRRRGCFGTSSEVLSQRLRGR